MRAIAGSVVALFVLAIPSLAFAGGPPGDSPETSLWIVLALGLIPVVWLVFRQLRGEPQEVRINSDHKDH